MTTRILPREEWPRLEQTELGVASQYLPEGTRVVVVEHEGDIIGCWAIVPYTHVEGLFVHPEHRSTGRVLLALAHATRGVLDDLGIGVVLTTCLEGDQVVEQLLERQEATRLPGKQYCMPVRGIGRCRR